MKSKRIVIASFLMAAVLCIGVGYAAVTNILDIQGTANVNATKMEEEFDKDIYFSDAVANTTGDTATVNADNNDKCTFTVNSLVTEGQTATFTFTIQNDYDHIVTVTPKLASNTNEEYFEVSSDWNGQAKDIAAGQPATYNLTVKLKKTPTSVVGTSISVELTAKAEVTTESST